MPPNPELRTPNPEPRTPNPEPRSVLDHLGKRAVVLADFDPAQHAGERHALFDRLLGYAHDDLCGLTIRVLQRNGHRHVEDVAELLDPHHDVLSLDAMRDLQLRQRRAVDPSL